MKNLLLIAFLFLFSWAVAQQVEPVRYEVSRWNKDQGCHFQTLDENDGIMINETDKTDKQKQSETAATVNNMKRVLSETWEELPEMILTSSVTRTGRNKLLDRIDEINQLLANDPQRNNKL